MDSLVVIVALVHDGFLGLVLILVVGAISSQIVVAWADAQAAALGAFAQAWASVLLTCKRVRLQIVLVPSFRF